MTGRLLHMLLPLLVRKHSQVHGRPAAPRLQGERGQGPDEQDPHQQQQEEGARCTSRALGPLRTLGSSSAPGTSRKKAMWFSWCLGMMSSRQSQPAAWKTSEYTFSRPASLISRERKSGIVHCSSDQRQEGGSGGAASDCCLVPMLTVKDPLAEPSTLSSSSAALGASSTRRSPSCTAVRGEGRWGAGKAARDRDASK